VTVEIFFSTIAAISLLVWFGSHLYDWVNIWRGVFPKPSNTTIDDIRQLRDKGYVGIAIKRFRQLPENKGIYTLKGADKIVSKL